MDSLWYIEYIATDGAQARHWIRSLPFRIGRDIDNDLYLTAPGLSRHHAELVADGTGRLLLADLGSTNGSFVNQIGRAHV
jgi:pSer/pThr/pTyr-binding forkhead associated (FHA) protein